jgi:hypothetical protein
MLKPKKYPRDAYPLELPSTMSAEEREIRAAEAKLAVTRRAKKKKAGGKLPVVGR